MQNKFIFIFLILIPFLLTGMASTEEFEDIMLEDADIQIRDKSSGIETIDNAAKNPILTSNIISALRRELEKEGSSTNIVDLLEKQWKLIEERNKVLSQVESDLHSTFFEDLDNNSTWQCSLQ